MFILSGPNNYKKNLLDNFHDKLIDLKIALIYANKRHYGKYILRQWVNTEKVNMVSTWYSFVQ